MDDPAGGLVEVGEARQDLRGDGPGLPLGQRGVLPEVRLEVPADTHLQHRGERAVVHLEDVEQADHSRVLQLLVDVVLADGVADVALLLRLAPRRVELVDLHGHLAQLVEVVGAVHLAEAALAQQVHQHVAVVEQMAIAEPAVVLVSAAFHLPAKSTKIKVISKPTSRQHSKTSAVFFVDLTTAHH
eukprot:scaffold152988_cov42-Prasinocladus_malaysianus.AAC.2